MGRRRVLRSPPAVAQRTEPCLNLPPELVRSIADNLGNYGMMMVLFETPSGFAILTIDEVCLYLPDAMENIWANFAVGYRARDVSAPSFLYPLSLLSSCSSPN